MRRKKFHVVFVKKNRSGQNGLAKRIKGRTGSYFEIQYYFLIGFLRALFNH